MASRQNMDIAINNVLPIFGVQKLKDEQKQIVYSILNKKDCIAVLPTGYGKSLPFQMYILLKRELQKLNGSGFVCDEKVLVCSPLVSLMQDQVQRMSKITEMITAYKGDTLEMDNKIKDGEVDLIYASPETLVGDPVWRSLIQKLNMTLIVVDEFHTIATWGTEPDDGKEAFRKWFSYIGELRSLFPNSVLLALSATCTLKIRKVATKSLNLHDATEITQSPNKRNIKLSVFKVPTSVEMAMTWVVDGLDAKRETFPKTIFYCSSIKDTSAIYNYLTTELPDCTQFINMYHSETADINKTDIINNLKNANSILRIVIATSALGMGIDVVNCWAVILYGAPNTAIELVQEIGRVGRDGNPSIALLLYNSYNIRLSEVKEVYKTTNCRRHTLMQYFLKPAELEALSDEIGVHTCCDICAHKCQCGKCKLLLLEKMFNDSKIEDVSDDDLEKQSDSDITEPYDLDQYDYFDDVDI